MDSAVHLIAVSVILSGCGVTLNDLRNGSLAVTLKVCLPVAKLEVTPKKFKQVYNCD